MKKKYSELEMSVIYFENEDIVTASSSLITLEQGENEIAFSILNGEKLY